jgi:acylphosphatase
MSKAARTVLFSGHVQGVGFRMTAVYLARGLPLSGTVRNLDDGRVELVVAGEPADIDTLIERLREQFGTFLRTVEQGPSSLPASDFTPGIRITF